MVAFLPSCCRALNAAEIQALRAQVKAQERAKFEEEKGKLLQDMMAREADVSSGGGASRTCTNPCH